MPRTDRPAGRPPIQDAVRYREDEGGDVRCSHNGYNAGQVRNSEKSVDHDGLSWAWRDGEEQAVWSAPYRRFSTAMPAAGNWKFVKHPIISQAKKWTRLAIREWQGTHRLGLHLIGFLVAVALLVYLGPFGTWASLSVSDRLVFWAAAVGVNWLAGLVVANVTIRAFQARKWPAWTGLVLASLIAALPGTGTVWMVVAAYLDYRPSSLSGIAGLYAKVLVLHLLVSSLVFHLIERSLRQREAGMESSSSLPDRTPAPPPAPEAALLARLPARSRAELLHLRMQDHYVEVHTKAGSEMLLLRFRDALREVEGIDGLQVHRSHWVARAAVVGIERQRGGRIALRLVNGAKVPVSRSFAPAVKARGWLRPGRVVGESGSG